MSDFFLCRGVRLVWEGLVAFGLLYALGETEPYGVMRRATVYDEPPRGHPERLRTELPLTDLERRLARELRTGTRRKGKAA